MNTSDFLSPEYLAELINDRKILATFPNMFVHVERLLDLGNFENTKNRFFFCKFFYAEINRVRNHLFNILSRPKVNLPTAEGEKKIYEEKIFIPTQLYPDVSSL